MMRRVSRLKRPSSRSRSPQQLFLINIPPTSGSSYLSIIIYFIVALLDAATSYGYSPVDLRDPDGSDY